MAAHSILRPLGGAPIAGLDPPLDAGRGLVGVVLSSTPGAEGIGIADAMRLWHKGACRLTQSNQTFGPPHLRDGGVRSNHASPLVSGDLLSLFNVFNLDNEGRICDGLFTGI